MTHRLSEIASELKAAYSELASVDIEKLHLDIDLAGRQGFLMPVEGWPGKNEEQRAIARDKVFADDTIIQEIRGKITTLQEAKINVGMRITCLEAERRGLEWTIRAQLTETLSVAGVHPNGNGNVAESAFDDVTDQVTESSIPF